MKANKNKAIIRAILAVVLCVPMLVAIKASASSGKMIHHQIGMIIPIRIPRT